MVGKSREKIVVRSRKKARFKVRAQIRQNLIDTRKKPDKSKDARRKKEKRRLLLDQTDNRNGQLFNLSAIPKPPPNLSFADKGKIPIKQSNLNIRNAVVNSSIAEEVISLSSDSDNIISDSSEVEEVEEEENVNDVAAASDDQLTDEDNTRSTSE